MKRVFEVVRAFSPTHQKGAINLGGHFTGTPVRAAKKAASRLCRESKIKGRCALNIEIKEITTGSGGQHFVYHVVRKKLNNPAVVEHNDIKIEHKYAVTAHPYDGPLVVVPPKKKKAAAAPKKKKVAAPKKKKAAAAPKKKKAAVVVRQPSGDDFIVDYSVDNQGGQHVFDQKVITPFTQQQKMTVQQPMKPPQQMMKPMQPVKPPQQKKGFFENLFG